ncbi:aspartate/glutamate racemase family protein [Tenacibaculum caenipelagi]|uniref:Aspartate racemase n=1 Tax=Tenacibaculum caenipelagi TaxID=1325435 RepID=A0A4R6THD9_9FLAO|nr:aspartate/glutamate racemase family protein [Tenacibaculum caenipelagi]TDQ29726.1 aspartate racemase [Tenacibaculum caenipelagi]
MRIIGLIGGITPQSTITYYQVLNDLAQQKYGGEHTAKVLVNSVDFGEISALQVAGKWDVLDTIMANAAASLEKAGASCIVICANTMHLCIEAVRNEVTIPAIHIAEATAEAIVEKQLKKVLLLGTKYTMEKTFYTDVLKSFGIDAIIPNQEDRNVIHHIIYAELAKGILSEKTKEKYLAIIEKACTEGAEGVILGCTEIPLLIKQNDVEIPVFDTTTIHATKAFNLSL